MPISTFLHSGTVSQLRGLQWLALADTGYVVGGSLTNDQGGGGTVVWTAGAAVPCRIDPLAGGGGGVTGDRINERSTHLVTVPAHTAVASAGRFAIDNRGTFEVTAVRDRTDEFTHRFEVVAV